MTMNRTPILKDGSFQVLGSISHSYPNVIHLEGRRRGDRGDVLEKENHKQIPPRRRRCAEVVMIHVFDNTGFLAFVVRWPQRIRVEPHFGDDM